MRKTLVGILALVLACSLWRLWPEADAADVVPLPPTPVASPAPDVAPLAWQEARPHNGAIGRNVFSFPAPENVGPALQPAPVTIVSAGPVREPALRPPSPPPAPAAPIFPYIYIGRFGPDANPIAVFSRDGEIVNARVGEVIGGTWMLKEIGVESVVVNDQRIGLATSS
ncbi:MAG TPA: hypothetical protein VGR02_10135 [Thermoanaerobaculia bacterium]|nr:hypothetical protein [Thermoanaerobaculia bacterium]